MEAFIVEEAALVDLKIVLVGVGGSACNTITYLQKELLASIDFIALNTNLESLENYDEIKSALCGADIVFIALELNEEIGIGASLIIARIAQKIGALTISIIIDFNFEDSIQVGIDEIKQESDSVIMIKNNKFLQVVNGISGLVSSSGENDINLDLADLKIIMGHKAKFRIGMGTDVGNNSAYEAVQFALSSLSIESTSIGSVNGVLVHFYINSSFPIMDIADSMDLVNESVNSEIPVLFGTTTEKNLPTDYVKVIIILTEFEEPCNKRMNNTSYRPL
ncbi:MAG: hypothetical protein Q9M43_02725 [Sulfurimonas sp.]|nr:hypothetical protein [Sulfurimonas sp.]